MATALEIAQAIYRREVGGTISDLFAATADAHVLREAIQTATERVAEEAQWKDLISTTTFTGDGSTEAFSLPSDFREMITGGDLRITGSKFALKYIPTLQEWQRLQDIPSPTGSRWTWYGGNVYINPALDTGTEVTMYYVTTGNWSTGGQYAASNSDTPVLPLPPLRAAAAYFWRSFQGLKTDEAFRMYARTLQHAIAQNGGGPLLERASGEDAEYDFYLYSL